MIIRNQHNQANQLTVAGQATFTYDNNGNMLTRADASASSNSTYTYDYENRLVRADRNASGNTTTSYYYYDPFGRRIVKTVFENSSFSRFIWYVYDREDILVERRNDSRPGYSNGLFLNIHGPNIDEPVAYTNNGQMYFYHADGLGSIKMITDGTGNITRRYSYDAYGNITASIIDRPYTYTGREYDDETGLYYYRARYYDPKIGRFISKDPIGFGGGDVNLYGYVGGNPVNFIDPWGLLSLDPNISKKYPRAAKRISSLDRRVSKRKLDAFKKYGQASQKDVLKALTPGKGPTINVCPLQGAYGQYTPGIGSNQIDISEQLMSDYEAGQASDKLLDATLEHELTHYLDDRDEVDYPGEEGNLYETDVYENVVNQ